jgi:hypothetical protein
MKISPIVALALAANLAVAHAGDPRFSEFAVRQAHERGFKGCDTGIRDALSSASGDDIRALSSNIPGTASDQLQLAAVWGRPGDVVMAELAIRVKGGRCFVHASSTMIVNKTCGGWLSDQSAFVPRSNTLGVLFARNAGGVEAILSPVGESCAIVFRRGASF